MAQILVLNAIFHEKESELFGEILSPEVSWGKYKMCLEHLMMPEHKKVLKFFLQTDEY